MRRGSLVLVVVVAAFVWPVAASAQLYWSNVGGGTIGSANADGTAVNQSLIAGGNQPEGMATAGGYVFWANYGGGTIGRAKLDGSDVNQSFITGADHPEGVAVDQQHVYWANTGATATSGSIGRADVGGSNVNQAFITGTTGPTAVAVDAGHVYWANFGGSIGRANIDGTSPNNTFIGGVIEPFGLAVNSQHIYWSNENGLAIGRAAIDGSSVNQTFMTPHGVTGVAVDSTYIYWAGINNSDPMNPAPEIGRALLNGTSSNPSFITGGEPYGITVAGPQAVATPASPTPFPTTAQGTLGAPATLTISNSGGDNLSISGLVFTGEDPGDFIITSDGCLGLVAPGASCQLTVAFVPQGQGARSATLQILSNDRFSPLLVPLSGTGGALPQGPAGQRGPTGATGLRGPAGPAGKIELVTCTTTTTKVHGHRRTVRRCTGRLVSGTIKFTTSTDHVTISRGRRVYATGVSLQLGRGVTQLLLSDVRPLRHGRYTLTTRSRRGRHLTTRRATLTIG
jgi:virginiamycin B lyase